MTRIKPQDATEVSAIHTLQPTADANLTTVRIRGMEVEAPKTKRGRPPGRPNKSTYQFRQTVQRVLENNQHKVAKWLEQVAEGEPPDPETGSKGIAPNPGRALELLAQLAEFAAPKLSRQEFVGDPNAPLFVAQIDAKKLSNEQLRALATIELPADHVRDVTEEQKDVADPDPNA